MVRRCVAVAMGGTSHEAEVSLRSGAAVAKALREVGYNVREAVLTEDSAREIPAGVEAVYIALHGGYGEGGDLQAALDALKLPYTGPGAAASRLCMDKTATRRVLAAAGLPVAEGCTVTEADAEDACRLALPVVVKPPRDGPVSASPRSPRPNSGLTRSAWPAPRTRPERPWSKPISQAENGLSASWTAPRCPFSKSMRPAAGTTIVPNTPPAFPPISFRLRTR